MVLINPEDAHLLFENSSTGERILGYKLEASILHHARRIYQSYVDKYSEEEIMDIVNKFVSNEIMKWSKLDIGNKQSLLY